MKIGYIRWSTLECNQETQAKALLSLGCEKIYQDEGIGTKAERPGFDRLLGSVKEGDCVVVWRLDRIGRNLKHLIDLVSDFENRGVGFISMWELINTTSAGKQSASTFFNALAYFEHNIVHERTLLGLKAARPRGRQGGRKEKLTEEQITTLLTMSKEKDKYSVRDVCRYFEISKPTYYRYINREKATELTKGIANEPPLSIKKVAGKKNRYKLAISEELKDVVQTLKGKKNVSLRIIPKSCKEGQEIMRRKEEEEKAKKGSDEDPCLICRL